MLAARKNTARSFPYWGHLDATVNLRQVSASAGLRICTRVTCNSFDQDSVLGAPLLLRIGIMKWVQFLLRLPLIRSIVFSHFFQETVTRATVSPHVVDYLLCRGRPWPLLGWNLSTRSTRLGCCHRGKALPNSLADNPHFRFEVSLTAKCGYAKL